MSEKNIVTIRPFQERSSALRLWPWEVSAVWQLSADQLRECLMMPEELKQYDISVEQWREYDFGGRVYRITAPVSLYMKSGGSMHRVVDGAGVVHCVPAPGDLT